MRNFLLSMKKKGIQYIHLIRAYVSVMGKWILLALLIGSVCGAVGTAFHYGVDIATGFRLENGFLLYLLPLLGVLIVFLYKKTKTEGQNTNDIFQAVNEDKSLNILLIPSIFIGTVLTHLGGGSVGREGAALQMGGDVGYQVGRLLHLDKDDMKVAVLAGTSAFFAALFGTPLAATLFSLMVVTIGKVYHAAFVPCFAAAFLSYAISLKLGVSPVRMKTVIPEESILMMGRVALLSIACALVSNLFCTILRVVKKILTTLFKSAYLRVIAGGILTILITLLIGSREYLGAGMDVITRAVTDGEAKPTAFLLKLILTAIAIGAGFKGGEVVPSFFIGATFGCVAGPLLSLPAGFSAAIGMIGVFCGAVNCPVAAIFLAIEIFGSEGLVFFALSCGICYAFSGYSSLYSSQIIMHSKIKAKLIEIYANQKSNDIT